MKRLMVSLYLEVGKRRIRCRCKDIMEEKEEEELAKRVPDEAREGWKEEMKKAVRTRKMSATISLDLFQALHDGNANVEMKEKAELLT